MALKSQDVVVGLYLSLWNGSTWTYSALSEALFLSVGEVHNSIQRLKDAGLVASETRRLKRAALEEFLIHGVKYAFAARRGSRTRGLPTGAGASPLKDLLTETTGEPPVWPYAEGMVWGYELEPLYKTVPQIVQRDPKMYELLALLDSIRSGGARERKLAQELLVERLRASKGVVLVQDAMLTAEY